jgi:lysophospholipase L1-like esterase
VTTAASQVFDAQAKLLAAQAGLAAAVMAPCFGLFTCAAKSNAVSAATAAVGAATLRLTQATTAFSGRVAALTAALVRLGLDLSPVNPFQNPASLTASVLDTSARLIRNGIANLTTLRETARDAAQAAVGVADGLVSSTLATLRTTEAGLTPTWQDRRCHRSTRSAQAMTALALEESDPRRSVTFVDLACSGATIAAGLLGPWVGVEDPGDGTTLPPQVLASKALIGPRTPDAVLLSVGGNDAGFDQIVLNCIAEARCHESGELDPNVRALGAGVCAILVAPVFLPACLAFFGPSPVESAAAVFERQRAALPQQYAALADRLNSTFGPGVPVYVTGYPNPTRDDQGAVCRFDPADPARALPGLSPEEGQWVDAYVLPTLNAAVQAAATAHGWRYVEPPAQATTHGYCAADHWFVRVQDSLFGQGNLNGVMHPNAAGYGAMAATLTTRVATDLG